MKFVLEECSLTLRFLFHLPFLHNWAVLLVKLVLKSWFEAAACSSFVFLPLKEKKWAVLYCSVRKKDVIILVW